MSNTTSWSLANDDALLGALQDISENLLSRTAQVLDKMDKLAHKAISVQIKLDNANNNFLGLSNTKFIEARVYDDNDEAIKTEDVPDNKLQLSEEEIIVEAFKQGLEFVNSDFEQVPIENSDSESDTEEEKTFYVLQPINKYHLRPLPAIIGTSEWFDDDKIGLADEDEVKGEEDEVQSETESEDETTEAAVRDKSKSEESDFSSDSDTELQTEEGKKVEQVIPPSSTRVDLSDTVSEFSDDNDDKLFKPKPKPSEAIKPTLSQNADTEKHDSGDIDSGKEENLDKSGTLNFTDELSSKLGLSMAPKLRNSDEIVDDSSHQSQKNETSKSRQKLMQKSTLFDSSDSDDDLFSGKTSLPKKAVKAESQKKDITKSEPRSTNKSKVLPPANDENRETSSPPQPQAIIPPAKRNILVDSTEDESDNEEPDIFADLKVTKPNIDEQDQDKKQISKGLFSLSEDSDTEDDIFADIGKAAKKAKTTEDKPKSSDRVAAEFSSTNDLFTDDGSSSRDVKNNEGPVNANNNSGEMSGLSNERAPEPEDVTSQPKKAPVGGVSMFGKGFNLGSLLKKNVSSDNDEAVDNVDGEKLDTATKKSDNNIELSIAHKSAVSDSSVLPINVGDMPSVEAKALNTVTKSRPKMNKGRRPPTRAGRKKVEDISLFTDLTEDKKTEAQQSSAAEILSSENVEPRQEVIKAPIGGVSLFGGFNPTDAFNKKSKEKEEDGILGSINSAPEDFHDSPSMALSRGDKESEEDDSPLFNGPPPMDSNTVKDTVSKGLFGDSDSEDDLFGDLITKTAKTGEKPNVPFSVKNNMFGFDEEDDDDDIFSDLMKKK